MLKNKGTTTSVVTNRSTIIFSVNNETITKGIIDIETNTNPINIILYISINFFITYQLFASIQK